MICQYLQFRWSPIIILTLLCSPSPITTAPGYAYGLKMSGSKNCVLVYFGDGAAQEGDSHAAMNFAATLKCPTIFFW